MKKLVFFPIKKKPLNELLFKSDLFAETDKKNIYNFLFTFLQVSSHNNMFKHQLFQKIEIFYECITVMVLPVIIFLQCASVVLLLYLPVY